MLLVYFGGSEEALILKGVKYNLNWKEKISIKIPDELGLGIHNTCTRGRLGSVSVYTMIKIKTESNFLQIWAVSDIDES